MLWFYDAGRYFPLRGAWIEGVITAIQVSVEGHSSATREDHAQQHFHEQMPLERMVKMRYCQSETYEGKWQCKNSVAELDQREIMGKPGKNTHKLLYISLYRQCYCLRQSI